MYDNYDDHNDNNYDNNDLINYIGISKGEVGKYEYQYFVNVIPIFT